MNLLQLDFTNTSSSIVLGKTKAQELAASGFTFSYEGEKIIAKVNNITNITIDEDNIANSAVIILSKGLNDNEEKALLPASWLDFGINSALESSLLLTLLFKSGFKVKAFQIEQVLQSDQEQSDPQIVMPIYTAVCETESLGLVGFFPNEFYIKGKDDVKLQSDLSVVLLCKYTNDLQSLADWARNEIFPDGLTFYNNK